MAKMLAKRGGTVLQAPTMQEVPLEDNTEALDYGEALMQGDCDALILMTGVGTRILIDALATKWPQQDVLKALSATFIVARSPKPVAALKEHKIKADLVAQEPNTWREILEEVDGHWPVSGKRVFIQQYGERNERLIDGLASRDASVTSVPVYGWQLPDDIAPLEVAIQKVVSGEVDCVAFTSAHQIRNLMLIAGKLNLAESLKEALCNRVVVASVGPFTSEAIITAGVPVDIEPTRPKMGHLVKAMTEKAPTCVAQKNPSHQSTEL